MNVDARSITAAESTASRLSRVSRIQGVRSARAFAVETGEGQWSLDDLAGTLVELRATYTTAAMTASARLLREAQERGEPVAWITCRPSAFHPPDLVRWGIDLAALPVVRAPDVRGLLRASDEILRSGAFGLVILDFPPDAMAPTALMTRLGGLATRHHAVVLCLTESRRDGASLGSIIGVRTAGVFRRESHGRFTWTLTALKDKRRGPRWRHSESCDGPDGLC